MNREIRLVIDFRALNFQVKRREYPLPTIEQLLTSIGGFNRASNLDLNMGYMSMPLTPFARKLLTVVMPFGFYECCVLPMGVLPATDKFQARMVGLFAPMIISERPDPYIDDILHTKGKDFGEHLEILDKILERLEASGMQINLKKSTLCARTLEFLGFQLESTGYRPTQKRVEAILRLDAPKNV